MINIRFSLKSTKVLFAAVLFGTVLSCFFSIKALAVTNVAYCSNWIETDKGWRLKSGSCYAAESWICDDKVPSNGENVWFMVDDKGYLIVSPLVHNSNGLYYSIETRQNGCYGMLRYQNGTYDGVYLEFASTGGGCFSEITNPEGIEALRARYGVTEADISEDSLIYTSLLLRPELSETSGSTSGGAERVAVDSGSAVDAAAETTPEGCLYFTKEMAYGLSYDAFYETFCADLTNAERAVFNSYPEEYKQYFYENFDTMAEQRVLVPCFYSVYASWRENNLSEGSVKSFDLYESAKEVYRLTNEERRKYGLKDLIWSDELSACAMIRAQELPGEFSHERPDGSECFTILDEHHVAWDAVSENITTATTAAGAMNLWMNSPGHRADILEAEMTHIGVGCYFNQSTCSWCYVQMFMRS